jgi:pectinesterase inhibitor-like protein
LLSSPETLTSIHNKQHSNLLTLATKGKGKKPKRKEKKKEKEMKQSQYLALLSTITLLSMAAIHVTATAPVQVRSDFIRSSCKATRYPAVCVQSLINYAPSVRHSPRQLAHAALNVSLARAKSTSAFINQLSPKPDKARSRRAGAIKDCLETMQDGVDQLRQSVKEMSRMGRMHTPRFRFLDKRKKNENNSFLRVLMLFLSILID